MIIRNVLLNNPNNIYFYFYTLQLLLNIGDQSGILQLRWAFVGAFFAIVLGLAENRLSFAQGGYPSIHSRQGVLRSVVNDHSYCSTNESINSSGLNIV